MAFAQKEYTRGQNPWIAAPCGRPAWLLLGQAREFEKCKDAKGQLRFSETKSQNQVKHAKIIERRCAAGSISGPQPRDRGVPGRAATLKNPNAFPRFQPPLPQRHAHTYSVVSFAPIATLAPSPSWLSALSPHTGKLLRFLVEGIFVHLCMFSKKHEMSMFASPSRAR